MYEFSKMLYATRGQLNQLQSIESTALPHLREIYLPNPTSNPEECAFIPESNPRPLDCIFWYLVIEGVSTAPGLHFRCGEKCSSQSLAAPRSEFKRRLGLCKRVGAPILSFAPHS